MTRNILLAGLAAGLAAAGAASAQTYHGQAYEPAYRSAPAYHHAYPQADPYAGAYHPSPGVDELVVRPGDRSRPPRFVIPMQGRALWEVAGEVHDAASAACAIHAEYDPLWTDNFPFGRAQEICTREAAADGMAQARRIERNRYPAYGYGYGYGYAPHQPYSR